MDISLKFCHIIHKKCVGIDLSGACESLDYTLHDIMCNSLAQ